MGPADAVTGPGDAVFEAARAVADAVLYEGYILYPYRKSSGKNRVRWQFGVLAPRPWIEARGPADHSVAGSAESWYSQTECLAEAPRSATLRFRVRFLQVQAKRVLRCSSDGVLHEVDSFEVGGQMHVSFAEAVPRLVDATTTVEALLGAGQEVPVDIPGGEDIEPILAADGREAGRVLRRRQPVTAVVRLSAQAASTPFPAIRLQIRTENIGGDLPPGATRDEALQRALIAAHSFAALDRGKFVSLLDPPAWAAAAAKECRNVHTFPVLTGKPDSASLVLSSPILLYDHPQVAPESPGDLHDAAEIDEILSLRTLTLTEQEKREARATDPRAAAIVDRVDAMPPEIMERLHGAIRSLRPASTNPEPDDPPEPAWWEPGGDAEVSPETDSVLVDGTRVSRGSTVRLRPRGRGTDAHDMFLAGRTATVAKVLLDVDGSRYVAVTVDDDPGADLIEAYGRFYQFSPDELELVPDAEGEVI